MAEDNFTVRLARAKLAAKDDIADFVKETDFYNELKNLNKKVTLKKTKHLPVENGLDELSEKDKLISTKGLTEDLINKYEILNSANFFLQMYYKII